MTICIYKVNEENFKGGVAAFYVNNKVYFLNLLRVYLHNRSLQLPRSSWGLLGQCYIAFQFLEGFSCLKCMYFSVRALALLASCQCSRLVLANLKGLYKAGHSGAMLPPDKAGGREFREKLSTDMI